MPDQKPQIQAIPESKARARLNFMPQPQSSSNASCPGDPVTYPCPPGHYCGSVNLTEPITLLAPQQCPEHTYRTAPGAQSLADCQPCPPGYLCQTPGPSLVQHLWKSVTPALLAIIAQTQRRQGCPMSKELFAHPGTSAHQVDIIVQKDHPSTTPPSSWTHGNSSLAKQPEECLACPAGSFNHLYAQTGCFPCGSSSSSQPGASSCSCHGLNRAFQESDGSCICQAGYVYYDERGKKNSDTNSDQDCQPQVEERCAPGEVRLASTRKCIAPELYDCSPFCGALGGELSAELGMCLCEQYISAEELCDRECLLNTPQISLSLGIHSELLLSVGEGEDREVTNILGPDEHVQKSQQVHLVLFGSTGVFGFIISSTDMLDTFLTGDFWLDLPWQRVRHGKQTASSKDTHPLPCIPNPIVCLNVGDAILFQLTIHPHNRTSSHYPVYQKQHLFNSNPGWDFGPFRRLDHLIRETHLNISRFAHVFLDPGRYVFRDSNVQERILIVAVNKENMGCDPVNASFQPSSPYQLARHGFLKHRALNLAPDWATISAVLFVLGFLTVVLFTLAIVLRPSISSPSPMNNWKPRWRSLGEPHIPPEYILIKDSLQFYEALGPRGSGRGADGGEKGVIHGPGEQPALRDLEDFSVRTLYDKLEDQNLHLASQMAKHRVDVLAFYRRISQRIQGLMDMVQTLDSEGLKGLSRQSISVHRTQGSIQAAMGIGQNDEMTSRDFQAMGHTGAEWREATELMKALKILLGKVHYEKTIVKQEPSQHVQGQDGTTESSLASQRKAGAEGRQDPGGLQHYGCSNKKGPFVTCEEQGLGPQPGRAKLACLTELEVESLMATSPLARTLREIRQALEKQQQCPIASAAGAYLNDSSLRSTRNSLVTTDLASLSPRQFVVYRFGCTVIRLLSRACSHPAVVLMLAQTVPDQSPEGVQEALQSPGDSYYDATNRFLYICSARLENAGEFISILLNAMAWIKAGSTAAATAHSCFQMELNKGITALANAFFQCSWGAVEKDPAEDKPSTCFDSQTIFEELLSIRMSPDPQFLEKSQHERLQHYQCFQLQAEIQDMMESLRRKGAMKRSGEGDKRNADSSGIQVAKLEKMLDGLNEEFFQLTVQSLTIQKEEEVLNQKLRIQEESFAVSSDLFQVIDRNVCNSPSWRQVSLLYVIQTQNKKGVICLRALLMEFVLTPAPEHRSDSAPSSATSVQGALLVPSTSRHQFPSPALTPTKKSKMSARGRFPTSHIDEGLRQLKVPSMPEALQEILTLLVPPTPAPAVPKPRDKPSLGPFRVSPPQWGENEKTLFNIHCKVQLLLESIKHCCGYDNEGEIELADVSGQVKNLLQNQHCYASELLSERETCVLLSVTRGEDSSEVVFTPLLKDEGVINPKFLAKLGNWEDSKASSTRVKSKKASKKPTVHLEVPSAEGKRSPSPQGNRTKTMVSSPKQSRRP
ncbi:uncharacterized protein ACDP82_019707 [Pangshura tecta]